MDMPGQHAYYEGDGTKNTYGLTMDHIDYGILWIELLDMNHINGIMD
jgi:hypothetical protein